MMVCSEYLEKLDLVEALMLERLQLTTSIDQHTKRLQLLEDNIKTLNVQIQMLEKQIILQHYTN